MTIDEYRTRLLAFIGEQATIVQLSRVDLACLLRVELDMSPRSTPEERLHFGKTTNSLIRVLREMDGAKPIATHRSKLRQLFPPKHISSAAPRFVSKMRKAAE